MNAANLIRTIRSVILHVALLAVSGEILGATLEYPQKGIKMVVPFPPGGSADIVARVISRRLADTVSQPVIIENKPGADGVIAADYVARSGPDGYTLFMATYGAMSAAPTIHKHIEYDSVADFTPISYTGRFALFLFVHPNVPVRTVGDLIFYARSHPGQLNYGTGNAASILAMAELAAKEKIELVHVPYKGEVPAMSDFVAGRIQLMFATPTNAATWVQEGKLRVLLTLQNRRSPLLPDAPTLEESGMKEFSVVPWAGLFGPAHMPKQVTEKLSRTINEILVQEDIRRLQIAVHEVLRVRFREAAQHVDGDRHCLGFSQRPAVEHVMQRLAV